MPPSFGIPLFRVGSVGKRLITGWLAVAIWACPLEHKMNYINPAIPLKNQSTNGRGYIMEAILC